MAPEPREPWRVFLVEDDATFAYLVEQVLAADGRFKLIGCAESIGPAVAGIEASPVDVLILDHGLPDAWGAQAAAVLRAGAPDVRVVVLSGTPASTDYAEMGVDRWVQKADVHDLPDVLAAVMAPPPR